MASRRKQAVARPAPRLYLVTPEIIDAASLTGTLETALAADSEDSIAAVLLRLSPADEATLSKHIAMLAPVVQDRGVALVVDGYARLAERTGADGAHLTGVSAFVAAVATLKPNRICGAGGLATRHDAMVVGEKGADYVMFGEPDQAGRRPSFAAVEERVAWWADLFEIPCVGWASSIDEVAPLVAAGADFVALGDWLWHDQQAVVDLIALAAGRLQVQETSA
ncbi:MAG: thiamine phosphate synthase [Pseudolabrys sp.]|nr:thiamine phosphate synthase [Pseudolabrys sp.]